MCRGLADECTAFSGRVTNLLGPVAEGWRDAVGQEAAKNVAAQTRGTLCPRLKHLEHETHGVAF